LVKAKKIRKEKALPKISEAEIPFELPVGWVWCRINDLTNVGTGSTPSKTNPEYYGGNIPWYTSSATNHLFTERAKKFITEKALKETNCKIFPSGTLIVAMYGQGKTRGQVSEIVEAGATNQAVSALVFLNSSKLLKKYIKIYFQKIYDEIRLLAEGGAQPNLNVGKIKKTAIPLPPFAEQKAIVEKVEHLMGLCDALEAAIKEREGKCSALMDGSMRGVLRR
jgi:type I restriction enzyme S subunit